MKKRIVSMLLAIVMVVGLVPASAFAAVASGLLTLPEVNAPDQASESLSAELLQEIEALFALLPQTVETSYDAAAGIAKLKDFGASSVQLYAGDLYDMTLENGYWQYVLPAENWNDDLMFYTYGPYGGGDEWNADYSADGSFSALYLPWVNVSPTAVMVTIAGQEDPYLSYAIHYSLPAGSLYGVNAYHIDLRGDGSCRDKAYVYYRSDGSVNMIYLYVGENHYTYYGDTEAWDTAPPAPYTVDDLLEKALFPFGGSTGGSGGESGGSGGEAVGSVTVTGNPVVGQTLTAETSGFDSGAVLRYQWYRAVESNTLIEGATERTYTLTETDLNHTIYCVVNGVESNRVGSVTRPATAAEVKYGADKDSLTNSGTLAEAIAAKAAYIQLQTNMESSRTVNFANSVTIDLNGKTLSADVDQSYGVFVKGDLTLTDSSAAKNGSLIGTSSQAYGVVAYEDITVESGSLTGTSSQDAGVYANSNLTVSGGSLTGKSSMEGGGIGVHVNGSLTVSGGELTGTSSVEALAGVYAGSLTVSGGTLSGTAEGSSGFGVHVNSSLTVSGGTLSGTVEGSTGIGVYVNSSLTVSGGELTATSNDLGVHAFETITVSGEGKITATGMSAVKFEDEANSSYSVKSETTDTATGLTTVVLVKKAETPVTEVKYGATAGASLTEGTLAEAIAANAAYIQLQKDITSEGMLTFNNSVTIDLNGKTLTATSDQSDGVWVVGDLTITDTSDAKNGSLSGTYTGADGYGVKARGSITVEDGSLTGTATGERSIGVSADGSITVNGGTLSGTGTIRGVLAGDSITVTGGTLTGTATGANSYGVEVRGSITVTGGSFSGEAPGANGIGVYSVSSITVNGGTLSGTGTIRGVLAGGSITVSGGTLTGTATGANGIGVWTPIITVENDGKITATGATAVQIINETGSSYSVKSETTDTATGLTTMVLVKKAETPVTAAVVIALETYLLPEQASEALVQIRDAANMVVASMTFIEFTEGKWTVEGLPSGDYTLCVPEVPNDYEIPADIPFTLHADGTMTTTGTVNEEGAILLKLEQATKYPLWVGGEQFTSAKLEISGGEGKAIYNPETNTLTLDNYSYSGAGYNNYAAMYYGGTDTLKLVLEGTSSVTQTGGRDGTSTGMDVAGSLDISGTGSLTVSSGTVPEDSFYGASTGIYVGRGTITVRGGTVTAKGGNLSGNNLILNCGIQANILTVSGGSLTGVGGNGAGLGSNGVTATRTTVSGGSLTGIGGNAAYSYGIEHTVTISGGEIIAQGGTQAFSPYTPTVDSSFTNAAVWFGESESAANEAGAKKPSELAADNTSKYIRIAEGTTASPVASVTTVGGVTTNYTDLAEAITAAKASEGSTLKLLGDITLDRYVSINSGSFTVDLNGKTWTFTGDGLRICGTADIILTDSSSDGTGKLLGNETHSMLFLYGSAKLDIQRGTLESHSLFLVDMAVFGDSTAELTVSGGKLLANGSDSTAIITRGALVKVTGGTIESGTENISYHTGVIDLSEHSDPTSITICNDVGEDVAVSETVLLPAGYALLDGGGNAVTTLVLYETYTVGKAPAFYSVSISAVDAADGNALAGATMQLIDSRGDVKEEWISTAEAHELTGLNTEEEYILRATVAPDGYTIPSDTTLIFKEDGRLIVNGTETEGTIPVEFEKTVVKLSAVEYGYEEDIEGAHLQICNEKGEPVEEWVSGTEAHTVIGLKTGVVYTLHAEAAPAGYTVADDFLFSIDENGNITTSGMKNVDGVLLVILNMTEVEVSAVDADSGEGIAGAVLQILNASGNVVDQWISAKDDEETEDVDESVHAVLGLNTEEEYTLRATVAPDGYTVPTDTTFLLDAEGKMVDGSAVIGENGVLPVSFIMTEAEFAAVDAANGEELEGAVLQLIDAQGIVVEEWTSMKEPMSIRALKTGVPFTLHVNTAPDGYDTPADVVFTLDESSSFVTEGDVDTDGILLIVFEQALPAITSVDFNRDSEAYDAQTNTFYIDEEHPLIITVRGEHLKGETVWFAAANAEMGMIGYKNVPFEEDAAGSSTMDLAAYRLVLKTMENYGWEKNIAYIGASLDFFSLNANDFIPLNVVEKTYEADITQPEGGEVSTDNENPVKGDQVTITVKPEEGKEVTDVTVTDKDGKEIEVTDNGDGTYTYEQPAGDVKVEVELKDSEYDVELPAPEGGQVETDKDNPTMGEQVTITVKPEEGKEVTDVTVTDKDGKEIEVTNNGDGTYTYEQPAGDVKVEVELKDSEYDIELPAPEGGQVESDKDNPTMGEQVTITVKPEEGKEVTDVTVTDKDGKEIEVTDNGDGTYTYEQPAGDVKVEVELKDSEYDVELPAPEGGQVESDKDNPTMGEQVTITVKPDEGKEVTDVTVTDKDGKEIEVTNNGDGTYTYEQPAGDVKVEVEFRWKSYKVIFTDWNGETLSEQTVEHGKAASSPADPARTGYTFTGWDQAFASVTEPMTLKAQYRINQYTIDFNTADGSAVESITQDYGTAVTKPADPTKTGYDFGGWYADAQHTTSYVFGTMPAESITVYAKWTPADGTAYTVRHYLQNTACNGYELYEGEVLRGVTGEQTAAAAKTYPGFTPKTFAQTAILPDGSAVVEIFYDRNTYRVTLVTNNGILLEETVAEYIYGIGAKLPTRIAKGGFFFTGWYDNEACFGRPVTEITATDIGDKVFYAGWFFNYIPQITIPTAFTPAVQNGGNGSVTHSPAAAKAGETVTVTVTPDAGYGVKSITASDSMGRAVALTDNGNGTYRFTQPAAQVTLKVVFDQAELVCLRDASCPMYGFTDLDRKEWYHDAIHFCIENGLMEGMGNNIFAPDGTLTRAMIVTVLWRLEGQPVVNYAMSYTDVPQDRWYSEAVRWASAVKIVEGHGNGTYAPEDPVTREQLSAILHRYAAYKGVKDGELSAMPPYRCSEWAVGDVKWADSNGLYDGIGNDMKDMTSAAPRSEIAWMLYRYCVINGK